MTLIWEKMGFRLGFKLRTTKRSNLIVKNCRVGSFYSFYGIVFQVLNLGVDTINTIVFRVLNLGADMVYFFQSMIVYCYDI